MTLPDNYPLTVGRVEDYPVKVGSMLLTLVDPNKGFESALSAVELANLMKVV